MMLLNSEEYLFDINPGLTLKKQDVEHRLQPVQDLHLHPDGGHRLHCGALCKVGYGVINVYILIKELTY